MQSLPILDASQIQHLDELTKQKYILPNDMLMELAGAKMAEFIQEKHYHSILLLCGKGNNGADALVIARHLILSQNNVHVYIFCLDESSSNPLFQLNFSRLTSISSSNYSFIKREDISTKHVDCIIDGLFGTGLNRPLSEDLNSLISEVNNINSAAKHSIDIPSGLNASTGVVSTVSFKADTVLSIGPKKIGFYLNDGANQNADIKSFSNGHDYSLIDCANFEIEYNLIKSKNLTRKHKYDDGFVQIIAGSEGLSGAAYLACKAALASGAPAVQLLYPKGLFPVFDCLLPEVLKVGIGETTDRFFTSNHFDALISEIEVKKGSLLIGPGLGRNKETMDLLSKLLPLIGKPLILDADALHVLNNSIKFSHANVILCPHIGELSVISHSKIDSDLDRLNWSKAIAKSYNCTVFSKGTYGWISQPDGKTHFLPYTNHHFRKTGYGDVFAGWLGCQLLENNSILQTIITTSIELYSKAIQYSPNELRPEHMVQ